ncbi:MAG: ATP-dependent Clp protease ATP-binding subunit ClpX, partial [Phycisphaerae bacterium]|nr:ATP-dependent Clp protease ATP-binding subunit ClpX [Phycisphaerae bacterium]
ICGGSFTGLEDIIKKRLGRQLIGFGHEQEHEESPTEHSDIVAQVQPEDLVHFGMIPELVGRLPCVRSLHELDEGAMIRILTEPRNALVRQYEQLFRMEATTLQFTDEALRAIAHKALGRNVGARALRSVVEELMLDLMYDLPDHKEEGAVYEITENMVSGEVEPTLFTARQVKKESA